jgi:hypothetical protein
LATGSKLSLNIRLKSTGRPGPDWPEPRTLHESKDLYSKKDMNLGKFNIDCM